MKKILAALLVASFGAGLMAQNYVYDYKASIKRIDSAYSIKSDTSGKYVAMSYKVASDTISGYVILPKCDNCNGEASSLAETFTANNKHAKGYFVRKGDKISKNAKLTKAAGGRAVGADVPYVLKAPVDGNAAIFGAYYHLQPADDYTLRSSVKAANKAWMALDYDLPNDAVSISTKNVLKNVGEENINIGFLGLTQTEMDDTTIYHTGFGAATIKSDPADLGWCGSTKATSCEMITSITGTLVGYPAYSGMCNKVPMWDVCFSETRTAPVLGPEGNPVINDDGSIQQQPVSIKDQEVHYAVICGTWTLKYNASLTQRYNNASGDANKEKDITDKLGSNIIYQNYSTTKAKYDETWK